MEVLLGIQVVLHGLRGIQIVSRDILLDILGPVGNFPEVQDIQSVVQDSGELQEILVVMMELRMQWLLDKERVLQASLALAEEDIQVYLRFVEESHPVEEENHPVEGDNRPVEEDNRLAEGDNHPVEVDNHPVEEDNHLAEEDNHPVVEDNHLAEEESHQSHLDIRQTVVR